MPHRLGRYVLHEVLGRGGMSVVYRALDGDRPVAVQVLEPPFAAYAELILAEIEPASLPHHPHLVDVLDSGRSVDGEAFFVLEYLAGTTLEDLIDAEAPLPWPRALRLIDRVAQGVDALHAAGLEHRDLKPENVMLLDDGGVKVLDLLGYGIARLYAEQEGITAAWGTPEYMSPEVAARRPDADRRADVHALGVILFDMLTGERPFTAATPREVMEWVRSVKPPLIREVRPDVDLPDGFEELLGRVMAKDPRQRPSSIAELREAWAVWLRTGYNVSPPCSPRGDNGVDL